MWLKAGFIWQPMNTSSVVGPRRRSKASSKAKLAPTKAHAHCFMVCCPSDPLQLSESWRNRYIWELGSASRWDVLKTATAAAVLVNRKSPVVFHDNARLHITQPVLQKTNKLGFISLYKVLSHPPYSPDLSPTSWQQLSPTSRQPFDLSPTSCQLSPLLQASLQLFCRENTSTISRVQKMLSKSL